MMTGGKRRGDGNGWCILRTSPGKTLKLMASLAQAGIEAWTPKTVERKRKPRGAKGFREVENPVLPTFVFARERHLADLFSECASHSRQHPAFSVFRYQQGYPIIADRDIAHFKAAEDRQHVRALKKQRRMFGVGDRVSVPEGSFAGLEGIVEDGDGKFALVCFNGGFRVKIATFLLRTDAVQHAEAREGIAA